MIRPTLAVRLVALVVGFVLFALGLALLTGQTNRVVTGGLARLTSEDLPALLHIREIRQSFERTHGANVRALRSEVVPEAEPDAHLPMRRLLSRLAEQDPGLSERIEATAKSFAAYQRMAAEVRAEKETATAVDPAATERRIQDLEEEAGPLAVQFELLEQEAHDVLSARVEQTSRELASMQRFTGIVSILGVLLLTLGVLGTGRRVVVGIRMLTDAAEEVARGRFRKDLDFSEMADDELGDLARAFGRMHRGLQVSTVSKDYVDRILDSMQDCLLVCDADRHIITANPASLRLLGWTPEDLVGRPFLSLVATQGEAREHFERCWRGLAEDESMHDLEIELLRKEGGSVPLTVSGAILAEGDGAIGGYVLSGSDFTERKQAEEDLREAKKQAEKAALAKSEFLATMSHEIRTPMTAILGFTETLLEPDLSEAERLDAVHTIAANGRHLVELINNILDLSKIEAGRLDVERIDVSSWELLEETFRLMKAPAEAKGLSLDLVALNDLPETIQTDPTRLRQILINLLGNAIKFTSEGTILIVVHFFSEPDPATGVEGPQLEIVVLDSGIGMTDEQVARVFEPFTQADGSMTRRFGGTGLGLTISKQLAVLLGGDIVVASEPGQGTAFRVSVATGPVEGVARVGLEEGRKRWKEKTRRPASRSGQASLQGARVLLVEDNPVNRKLALRILEKAGARVACADDGTMGLEMLEQAIATNDPPHILLTDMHLPGLDGGALARLAREADFRGAILSFSAGAVPEDLRGRFDGAVAKPIDRKLMLDVIGTHARRVRGQESGREDPSVELNPAAGLRVLIVEDTPVNQRLVQHILKKAGAETVLADNGQQALDAVWNEENPRDFDVVLMDIQMPVLDGIQATRQLRAKGFEAPIIAFTANATTADRERCLAAGCDAFVPKPLDRRKLVSEVVQLAARKRVRTTLSS